MKHLRSFYKGKRVLVTGGAGFIGSHLSQILCSYGANVTILDDLSTGSISNLSSFFNDVTLLANDITSFKTCLKATRHQEIVFHIAAFVSVPESIKYPALCEKINTEGTSNLLESCRMNNVSRFIFSSSAAVYGNRNDVCNEDDKPNPQSPYAQSKLDSENLCKEYAQKYNLDTACLRYFNVYGERQNPHGEYSGVVARFKEHLTTNKPIVVYGNGEQTRDFVCVSDVVEANLLVGTISPLNGTVFNVATGKSITLLELLKTLESETGKKAILSFKPARQGDITNSIASCRKLQTIKEMLI